MSKFIAFILITLLSAGVAAAQDAVVKKIFDGDTVVLQFKGRTERTRFIGMDAPESRDNDKAERDAEHTGQSLKFIVRLGKEATAHLKMLMPEGSNVKVEVGAESRDKYGRLLAYIFLQDGSMINERMLKDGYANIMTVPPNIKYQKRLRKALADAWLHDRGLWSEE